MKNKGLSVRKWAFEFHFDRMINGDDGIVMGMTVR